MAKTTRQTVIFGVEDWKRIYQTYREADFQSYDFETLRKSFVEYKGLVIGLVLVECLRVQVSGRRR